MNVVIMSKNSFNVTTLTLVSSISYASDTYTIVSNGVTYTYAKADYNICILW